MRLIGAASIVLAFALTSAVSSGPGPAITVPQPAAGEAQGGANRHDEGRNTHDGQAIFRYDTFGDEQLWTDVLRMHEVLATVPPATALGVGLKVDVEALPPGLKTALLAGEVDLADPVR